MNCPRCHAELSETSVRDVAAQVCPRCTGMFLHRGELNKIAEPTDGDLEFSTVDLDSFSHADEHPETACPECPEAGMKKVEFNIYTGVVLDHCERCGGFWLDGDELTRINDEVRKLNEASEDSQEPAMLWFARFIWSLPR